MKQSIVIRGGLVFPKHPTSYINETISRMRRWFSGEIVVSTWHGHEHHIDPATDIDKLVLTSDPGPGPIQQWKRQAISYTNGVEQASGDEIMVTRSDIAHDKDLFAMRNKYLLSTDTLKVFQSKLLVANMMTINPDSAEIPNTFRVSDWIQVGSKQDIFKWADILHQVNNINPEQLAQHNCCTETLWFLSVIKNQYPNIDIYNSADINQYAWHAIVNNFIVLNMYSTMKAVNLNWSSQPENIGCYVTEATYQQKYQEIIGNIVV